MGASSSSTAAQRSTATEAAARVQASALLRHGCLQQQLAVAVWGPGYRACRQQQQRGTAVVQLCALSSLGGRLGLSAAYQWGDWACV
jgi:hypothetical protein